MEAIKRLLAKLTPLQRRLGGFALLVAASMAAYFGLFARDERERVQRAAVHRRVHGGELFGGRPPSGSELFHQRARIALPRGIRHERHCTGAAHAGFDSTTVA